MMLPWDLDAAVGQDNGLGGALPLLLPLLPPLPLLLPLLPPLSLLLPVWAAGSLGCCCRLHGSDSRVFKANKILHAAFQGCLAPNTVC
jgi:hypothetical protein